MDTNKIYLHVEKDERGVLAAYDQHGRRVAGVRAVALRHAVDECVSFTLEAFDYAGGTLPWAPGRAKEAD